MQRLPNPIPRRAVTPMLVVALAFTLVACDTTSALVDTRTPDHPAAAAMAETLVADLSLSKEEAAPIQAAFAEHESQIQEPGYLWRVAGTLNQELMPDQKATLFEQQAAKREARQVRQAQQRPRQARMRQQRRRGLTGQGRDEGFARGRRAPQGQNPMQGLDLTEDQKAALQEVREAYKAQFGDLRQRVKDGTTTRTEAREEGRALRESLQADLQAHLTPEQREQVAARQAERKAHAAQRQAEMKARQAAAEAVRIDVLGLTPTQQEALDALHAQRKAEREATRAQIKGGDLDRDGARETVHAARTDHTAALATILTAEQMDIIKLHGVLAARHAEARLKANDRRSQRGRRPARRGH